MKVHWGIRWSAIILIALLMLPLAAVAAPATTPTTRIDPRALQAVAKGNGTFWVVMRQKADLSRAYTMRDWNARGQFVVDRLQAVANASQAGIRAQLTAQGKQYRSFWIVNALQVTADSATLKALGSRTDVAEIAADQVYSIPTPAPGTREVTINAIEWGVNNIGAPQVWSTFGARGDGIVVASIDTGVMYNHPALVRQYRGNLGGGSFDHNYNWYDPANACASPSLVPCDNNGHGSHTMGTMIGDDGAGNQIGVAPNAKWIAAKGCESSSCTTTSLVSSGQWVLAPTNLNGQNPRADLRPNIVNNSWGNTDGSDAFYQSIVQSWVASGIFPAFANGNSGPSCGTVGAPGSYPESYGVGAYDSTNTIASFSSRGAAPAAVGGQTKPDISAPGVNIRSSWNDGTYNTISGTSMATPHLAGAVALMWSAAPSLIGDIAQTRALLDQTAIDTSDLSCGGTAADNNVYGQGRLDAFAAVSASPRGPTGTLSGRVTNASGGAAIAGATVSVSGPTNRSTTTDANGNYSMTLPTGTYNVSVSAFGFTGQTASAVVNTGATTTQNFALVQAPSFTLSGVVRDSASQPIANATVTIQGTPIAPATTNASGAYSFASVPAGTYNVQADAGRCFNTQTQNVTISGATTLNFTLTARADSFGYTCKPVTGSFILASTALALTGDDASAVVNLPFSFTFYGKKYTRANVSTNGHLSFTAASTAYSNSTIPDSAVPNAAIYPFWDDLNVDASASVRTQTLGTSPNRQFVIEWRNVAFFSDSTKRVSFEVILFENGNIQTQYNDIAADGMEQGNSATSGIENSTGTVALQYSNNEAVFNTGTAILYKKP